MTRRNQLKACEMAAALLVFSLLVIFVFAPTLFSCSPLFMGDDPGLRLHEISLPSILYHYLGNWSDFSIGDGYGATALNPLRLLRDLVTVSSKHLFLTYSISCLLVFLGTVYYLGAIGINGPARFAPGIALAFSGYSFTLISAGHAGFFQMMAYCIFMFGFLHRAVTRGSALHYALTASFAVWGIAVQPDMMIPFSLVAGAYALLFLLRTHHSLEKPKRRTFLTKTGIGVAIGLVFLVAFGIGTFGFLFETIIPQRDVESGGSAREKWIFMTNWSFPPSEAIEFVSPNIFGIETANQEAPYWGELGRPYNWRHDVDAATRAYRQTQDPQIQKRAFNVYSQLLQRRNLRQHTVYLGVLQVMFALFAACLALRRDPVAAHMLTPDTGEVVPKQEGTLRPYVLFWLSVAIISLLFSFGRYAPFYRIPYQIPYLNKIRAPIKYLRLVEISICFLFGIGISAFLRGLKGWPLVAAGSTPRRERRMVTATYIPKRTFGVVSLIACVCAAGFLLALLIRASSMTSLYQLWEFLGLGAYKEALRGRFLGSLFHSTFMFATCSVLFFVASKVKATARFGRAFPWILLILVAADVGWVGRNFIHVRDRSVYYVDNPVAETINRANAHYRTDNLLMPYNQLNPLSFNWVYHGVYSLRPSSPQSLSDDSRSFFDALNRYPYRLWELTSTKFILAENSSLSSLVRDGIVWPLQGFDVVNGRYSVQEKATHTYGLYEFGNPLPFACLFEDWAPVSHGEALKKLPSAEWSPSRTLLVETDKACPNVESKPCVPATVDIKGRTRIVVTAEVSKPSVLLVNEKYHPDVRVSVDGRAAELLRCNYIMRGVMLPPGKHRIVFRYYPYIIPLSLNIAFTVLLGIWLMASVVRRKTNSATSSRMCATVSEPEDG